MTIELFLNDDIRIKCFISILWKFGVIQIF